MASHADGQGPGAAIGRGVRRLRRALGLAVVAGAISVAGVFGGGALLEYRYPSQFGVGQEPTPLPAHLAATLIAHAGGGLPDGRYSNALEALNASYAAGLRVFEIDFSVTADGHWVAIHDWDESYSVWFDGRPLLTPAMAKLAKNHLSPPTLEEFLERPMRGGLTQMRMEDVAAWLHAHPDAELVTDVKDADARGDVDVSRRDNYAALAALAQIAGPTLPRIRPQIYQIDEIEAVAALGYERPVLTLYRTRLSDDEVVAFARSHELRAVTMPEMRAAQSDLPRRLRAVGVDAWTHTVNASATAAALYERGINGFYTDYLVPAGPPSTETTTR